MEYIWHSIYRDFFSFLTRYANQTDSYFQLKIFYYIPHPSLQKKCNVREFITYNITCVYGSV